MAWIGAAIAGVAAIAAALIQNSSNKKIAETQHDANVQLQKEQNEYNSPKSQMMRFQDAKLNPNLIYGNGSASAGNQASPLTYPDRKPPDIQGLMSTMALINQTRMTEAQVQATNAKTTHTYTLTQLAQVQKQVLAANPLLNATGLNAIIEALKSTAEIKASESTLIGQQAEWATGEKSFKDIQTGEEMHGPAGAVKMETELKLLMQKFKLSEQDEKVKAEIINSKEFANQLQEIQLKWMKDGDITPQHIYQFIQLLLMKML